MIRMMMKVTSAMVTGLLVAAGSYAAEPVLLTEAQMDLVTAAGVERVDSFVCPVITTDAVLNSPKGGELGDTGDYTIGGPDVWVPKHATNDNGDGVPKGDHASPGDITYTAIWAR